MHKDIIKPNFNDLFGTKEILDLFSKRLGSESDHKEVYGAAMDMALALVASRSFDLGLLGGIGSKVVSTAERICAASNGKIGGREAMLIATEIKDALDAEIGKALGEGKGRSTS